MNNQYVIRVCRQDGSTPLDKPEFYYCDATTQYEARSQMSRDRPGYEVVFIGLVDEIMEYNNRARNIHGERAVIDIGNPPPSGT